MTTAAWDHADACAARQQRRARKQTAWVDPTPARQHLAHLRQQGIGLDRIAQLSGLSRRTLAYLAQGRFKVVHTATERAVLSTRPIPAPGQHIPAQGTLRCLRVLLREGFEIPILSVYLDLHPGWFRRYCQAMTVDDATRRKGVPWTVTVRTAAKVRALFRRTVEDEPCP